LLLVPSNACSVWVDADRVQCEQPADCLEDRTGVADLSCIAGVCRTVESSDDGDGDCPDVETVSQGWVGIYNPSSGKRIAGASVRLCNGLDAACSDPVFDGITGPDGKVPISVPPAFSTGFYEVWAEDYVPIVVTAIRPVLVDRRGVPIPTPFDDDPGPLMAIPLLSEFERNGLYALLGGTNDPTRGAPAADLAPCLFEGKRRQIGLDLIDDASLSWCLVDGLPTQGADIVRDGVCGFINARPGFGTMTVTDLDTDEVVATAPILIRAGWISSVPISTETE
jgi:hypothetical protein